MLKYIIPFIILQVAFANECPNLLSSNNDVTIHVEQQTSKVGYNTYRVMADLSGNAKNVYTMAGTPDLEMKLPPSFQVATPFGVNTGGVNPAFESFEPDSQFDSWIGLGTTEAEKTLSLSPGFNFDIWTETSSLTTSDGAVFYMDPVDDGAVGSDIVLAQLTVVNGVDVCDMSFLLKGKSESGSDWTAYVGGECSEPNMMFTGTCQAISGAFNLDVNNFCSTIQAGQLPGLTGNCDLICCGGVAPGGQPCQAEMNACMADADCSSITQVNGDVDMNACNANQFCATLMQCFGGGGGGGGPSCEAEEDSCNADVGCQPVLESAKNCPGGDMNCIGNTGCMDNDLCLAYFNCMMGGGGPPGGSGSGGGSGQVVQQTQAPTNPPTDAPTNPPTDAPTNPPTDAPTNPPTDAPTNPPTDAPTNPPTDAPTNPPTDAPTVTPGTSIMQQYFNGENCQHIDSSNMFYHDNVEIKVQTEGIQNSINFNIGWKLQFSSQFFRNDNGNMLLMMNIVEKDSSAVNDGCRFNLNDMTYNSESSAMESVLTVSDTVLHNCANDATLFDIVFKTCFCDETDLNMCLTHETVAVNLYENQLENIVHSHEAVENAYMPITTQAIDNYIFEFISSPQVGVNVCNREYSTDGQYQIGLTDQTAQGNLDNHKLCTEASVQRTQAEPFFVGDDFKVSYHMDTNYNKKLDVSRMYMYVTNKDYIDENTCTHTEVATQDNNILDDGECYGMQLVYSGQSNNGVDFIKYDSDNVFKANDGTNWVSVGDAHEWVNVQFTIPDATTLANYCGSTCTMYINTVFNMENMAVGRRLRQHDGEQQDGETSTSVYKLHTHEHAHEVEHKDEHKVEHKDDDGLSDEAIVGIVFGSVAVVALFGGLFYWRRDPVRNTQRSVSKFTTNLIHKEV